METKQGIVLAGGSGFLGQTLANHHTKQGHAVGVLTRSPVKRNPQVEEVYWDGQTFGEWAVALDGALAVVNLAGRSVNCRYHRRNRQAILESRVRSTRVLG